MSCISELPECLITQILSYLPTKDSVSTSVLATSWKNHWLNVPVLELNFNDFSSQDVFDALINRFLRLSSRLQNFKVKSTRVEIEGFTDLIRIWFKRRIQHLDLVFKGCRYYRDVDEGLYSLNEVMPLNLYTSKALVSLKLSCLALEDCGFVVVYLPCLKLMKLRKIRFVAPMNLDKLLLGCPVLEELTLLRDLYSPVEEPVVTRVRSCSLKRFYVPFKRKPLYGISYKEDYVLEIDAPGLEYMSLKGDYFHTCVVKNLTSLFPIDLDLKFTVDCFITFDPEDLSKRDEIRDFLTGITSVRHMILSEYAVETLYTYSKVGPIPKFNNLSRLEAELSDSPLQFVHVLLESCPNLKHLIWNCYDQEIDAFEVVPRCLVSTLECVEMRDVSNWREAS